MSANHSEADASASASSTAIRMSPDDEYNRVLIDHVHPPDWVNPAPADRYNMVVIGAGTAGLVTAIGAAGLGARVALIERHLMGGDCLNVGCVPSKALIRSGRAMAHVRDASEFGVHVPAGASVDFGQVMERMRRLRAAISPNDSAARFRDQGIDVFLGNGVFTGPDTVQVGEHTLRFRRACIATGARATQLPVPGLEEAGALDNETVFSLTELPARLAVIGAGPIGSELAQSFARFGSKVTVIERATSILGREDRDAAELVRQSMERDGVEFVLDAAIESVEATDAGKRIHISVDGSTRMVEVDEILVGAGRTPNVNGLGLEQAGVRFDPRTGVEVDERLRTSNPNIYAAGDVASKYKFTHAADFLARTVIRNALFFGRAKASALTIPWSTYTSPEVAHVGLYEHDAREQGIEIDTFLQPFEDVDRAILDGDTSGFVKVHVKKGTDKIVGATIVAEHAGDLISELTLAMTQGVGLGTLASVIHPYPTQAEAIRKIGDAYNRTRLKPGTKRFLEKFFAWRR